MPGGSTAPRSRKSYAAVRRFPVAKSAQDARDQVFRPPGLSHASLHQDAVRRALDMRWV